MAEKLYQRLTRSKRKGKWLTLTPTTLRSSVWLGPDHLLSVESRRYTEGYKRFYFRDIQAITIRKTERRQRWNIVLALSLLMWVVLLAANIFTSGFLPNTDSLISWGFWLALIVILLFVNNALGDTCTAYLKTAVQIEELPSIRRVRRAQTILNRIRPLIAAAQGQLDG